jgi:transcriptional regulator
MYVPPLFAEDRIEVLHEGIRNTGLATLVTLGSDGLIASHVPLLLDSGAGPHGTLHGHIARANPQWRDIRSEVPALAIFPGPDAYITPAWYETKRQTGKVVPTWNYTAIHAYGTLDFFDDTERLLDLVGRLTESREAKRAAPWAVSDAPAEFIAGMLNAIVGFTLPIARIEGKWKMSQNRPAEDRAAVVEGLIREGGPTEAAVAAIVAERGRS